MVAIITGRVPRYTQSLHRARTVVKSTLQIKTCLLVKESWGGRVLPLRRRHPAQLLSLFQRANPKTV